MLKILRFARSESRSDNYKLVGFISLSIVVLIMVSWLAKIGGLNFITSQSFNVLFILLLIYTSSHSIIKDTSRKNIVMLLNAIAVVGISIMVLEEYYINALSLGMVFSFGTFILSVVIIATPLGDLKVSRSLKIKLTGAVAVIALVAGAQFGEFNLKELNLPLIILLVTSLALIIYIQSLRTEDERVKRVGLFKVGYKIYGVLSLFIAVGLVYTFAFL